MLCSRRLQIDVCELGAVRLVFGTEIDVASIRRWRKTRLRMVLNVSQAMMHGAYDISCTQQSETKSGSSLSETVIRKATLHKGMLCEGCRCASNDCLAIIERYGLYHWKSLLPRPEQGGGRYFLKVWLSCTRCCDWQPVNLFLHQKTRALVSSNHKGTWYHPLTT